MEWTQFAIFFIGVFGLFIWNCAEARADARHMDSKLDSQRLATEAFLKGIQQEMKDFHGRLVRQDAEFRQRFLAIEERRSKENHL